LKEKRMKKRKKLKISLNRETLRGLEMHTVLGGMDTIVNTQCDECNTRYSICIYIACSPPPG